MMSCTYSVSKQDFNGRFLATTWTFAFHYKSLTVLKEGDKKKKLKKQKKNRTTRATFGISLYCYFRL